jgi:TatD DNase family protein
LVLADSHCHLDDEQFAADQAEVRERAAQAGLQYMLSIGTGEGPPDLQAAIRQAEAHTEVLATVGVHPNDALKATDGTFDHLRELLPHPKVVAVGEIGLDYHWDVPKSAQHPIFVRQIEMAAQAGLPVIIHTRDAWEDTEAVLREVWLGSGVPCVMHCFTGNKAQAEAFLEMGCVLAFGGVVTYPKSAAVREALLATPNDRLLLETDAPYLPPVPHRGKRNEPSYILHTARAVAAVRGQTLQEVAAETTANFERIFLGVKARAIEAEGLPSESMHSSDQTGETC